MSRFGTHTVRNQGSLAEATGHTLRETPWRLRGVNDPLQASLVREHINSSFFVEGGMPRTYPIAP